MWGQVLTSKYGGWHGLMGNSALSWKSLWWKDLKKLCGSEVDNPWFEENTVWKIGRGDKCRFWKDVWVNGNSLANLFPRLYLISEQKEELIEVMGCWRGPFEWESGLIQQVKALVETILVNKDESDYWKWSRCG